MIDITRLFSSPNFSEHFTIYRKAGEWVEGGEFEQGEKPIKMYAPVQPSSNKEVQMVPEGDRITGMMTFWSKIEIFTTNKQGTSDELEWRGERYKVLYVIPWLSYGFCQAIAVRKAGN